MPSAARRLRAEVDQARSTSRSSCSSPIMSSPVHDRIRCRDAGAATLCEHYVKRPRPGERRGPSVSEAVEVFVLPEQRQDALAVRVGDAERLDAELLLNLESATGAPIPRSCPHRRAGQCRGRSRPSGCREGLLRGDARLGGAERRGGGAHGMMACLPP